MLRDMKNRLDDHSRHEVSKPPASGRAAFVYGGDTDFKLTQRLFLRTEYRGLV